MKKSVFSVIAVATFAVSSLFVSCDKNETGSTYGGGVDIEQPTKSDSQSGVSNLSIYANYYCTEMVKGAQDSIVEYMAAFLQEKVGSTGKISTTISTITGAKKLVMCPTSDATEQYFVNALSNIQASEIDEAVSKKVSGFTTFTFKLKINNSYVLNYEYKNSAYVLAGTPVGTWTATVDGKTYSLNITDATYNGNSDRKIATLTIDGQKCDGYATSVGTIAVFYSTKMSEKDSYAHQYRLTMKFSTPTSLDTCAGTLYVDGNQTFKGQTFNK